MKCIRMIGVFPVIVYCCLFFSFDTNAQSWEWGVTNVPNAGFVEPAPIAVDGAGNVFVSGYFGNTPSLTIGAYTIYSGPSQPLFVVKANSTGIVQWVTGTQRGFCNALSLATDKTGNVYVMGQYYWDDTLSFGSFILSNDSLFVMDFIAKLSPMGNVLWARNVASSTVQNVVGRLKLDDSDHLYVTGAFNKHSITIGTTTLVNTSATGDSDDVYIAKYDSSGNVIWAKSFGGHNTDFPEGMSVTNDGSIFIAGESASNTMIIGSDTFSNSYFPESTSFISRFDSWGNLEWVKDINKNAVVMDMITDVSGNSFVTGSLYASITLGIDSLSGPGAFIAKYDSSGSIVWANSAQTSVPGAVISVTSGYSIGLDTSGNAWIAGPTEGIMNFNGYFVDTPTMPLDLMYIAAYDHCGKYIAGTGLEVASGGDDLLGIALDKMGNLYLGVDLLANPLVFGPDTLVPGAPYESLLLAKYSYGSLPGDSLSANFSNTTGQTDSFTYTGTLPIDSLSWNFGDGSTSTTANPVHTFLSPGVYMVCVTIFSSCPAGTKTYCKPVNVTEGITNISGNHFINLFPNPATSQLTITSQIPINQITVTNLLGQTVFSNNYNTEKAVVEVANLPGGVYFVKVNGSEVRKFVKE